MIGGSRGLVAGWSEQGIMFSISFFWLKNVAPYNAFIYLVLMGLVTEIESFLFETNHLSVNLFQEQFLVLSWYYKTANRSMVAQW